MKNSADERWLEELLWQKNYEQLNSEEREWVDQQISPEEYYQMRATLLSSHQALQTERTKAAPEVGQQLRQHFRQQAPRSPLQKAASYQIPAWQAVAASILFLFFFAQMSKVNSPSPEQVIVYHTDTIYKEVPVEAVYPNDSSITAPTSIRTVSKPAKLNPPLPTEIRPVRSQTRQYVIPKQYLPPRNTEQYDTAVMNRLINNYLMDSAKDYRATIDGTLLQTASQVY